MQGNYKTEFSKGWWPPPALVKALEANGFKDISWGNDTCPSWSNGNLKVWTAPKDDDLRECGMYRYAVSTYDEDGERDCVFSIESTETMINWLNAGHYKPFLRLASVALKPVPSVEEQAARQSARLQKGSAPVTQKKTMIDTLTDLGKMYHGNTKLTQAVLDKFRSTRRAVADLGTVVKDLNLDGHPGLIYCNSLFIEDTTYWSKDAPGYGKGRWYTLIGREEPQSDDLAVVEYPLAAYALSEGFLFMDEADEVIDVCAAAMRKTAAFDWKTGDGASDMYAAVAKALVAADAFRNKRAKNPAPRIDLLERALSVLECYDMNDENVELLDEMRVAVGQKPLAKEVTIGDLWTGALGKDTASAALVDMGTNLWNMSASSNCGKDCCKAIEATAKLLAQLDPHDNVRHPILDGLVNHMCILFRG